MAKKKTVVLGAGLAGLAAGWELARQGHEVEIVEAHQRIGGLATSFRRGAFTFDYGPHRFHTNNEEVMGIVRAFLGDRLVARTRRTCIYLNGRFFDYPMNVSNVFFGLAPPTALRCFMGFIQARLSQKLHNRAEEDFESWVVHRYGKPLFDLYFGPYTEKVWKTATSRLSARWASQGVPELSLREAIMRTLFPRMGGGQEDENPHSFRVDTFHYPLGGVGEIAEAFEREIVGAGGRIRLGAEAVSVGIEDGRACHVDVRGDGADGRLDGDFIVSSIPITTLMGILDPAPPEGPADAAKGLTFVRSALLYLIVDKERVSPHHWIYFSDPGVLFNRFTEFRNFSDEMQPPGKTSLCLEVSYNEGDEIDTMDESELTRRCVEALEEASMLRRADVLETFVVRLRWGYPMFDLGYEGRLRKIFDFLRGVPNLMTTGRQGLFRYSNTAHAIEMGLKAARSLESTALRDELLRFTQDERYFG